MSLTESTHKGQGRQSNSKATESKHEHQTFRIKKEPVKERNPYRKHLAYQEASSAMIKTKLKDQLGRIPWSNYPSVASYGGGNGGLSQQRLLSIMNQLTNDIRVNGRRVTPLQAQIVQQASNGNINPSSSLNDMQSDIVNNVEDSMQTNMQDDMQNNQPNGMQDDTNESEIKPIQMPMNKGRSGEQSMQSNTLERLMFGGLSQIVGGTGEHTKGNSDFGGGMSNVPGLSFGGGSDSGVINLMESENGLKPMTGMNRMQGMSMMNGMGMVNTMGGMGGKMLGGGPFFSRRAETVSQKQNERSKQKGDKSHRVNHAKKVHLTQSAKASIIRLLPHGILSPTKKSPKSKLHRHN